MRKPLEKGSRRWNLVERVKQDFVTNVGPATTGASRWCYDRCRKENDERKTAGEKMLNKWRKDASGTPPGEWLDWRQRSLGAPSTLLVSDNINDDHKEVAACKGRVVQEGWVWMACARLEACSVGR